VGLGKTRAASKIRRFISKCALDVFAAKGTGGAAYIDLFSGPGRSQVEGTDEFIDGSPIVAYKAAQFSGTRFSDLHFNDLDPDNVQALRQRIVGLGGAAQYYNEAAETAVDRITYALNPAGLHFTFLDPYNLENLPFSSSQSLRSCHEWTC
jgi:three-Cys-motif partner protein